MPKRKKRAKFRRHFAAAAFDAAAAFAAAAFGVLVLGVRRRSHRLPDPQYRSKLILHPQASPPPPFAEAESNRCVKSLFLIVSLCKFAIGYVHTSLNYKLHFSQ